ncbi:hypothetical protein JAAARDRAFT_103966, partial [Jaapia argillacea MUCL 33604]
KIETLFGISAQQIGVSYVDNDGDEVTLSTDEELRDYYSTAHQAGQVIKFIVHNL